MRLPHIIYFCCTILLILIAGFFALFYTPLSSSASFSVFSPLPAFLTRLTNQQVTSLNIWSPESDKGPSGLSLTATSVLSYDLTTNQVLYSKNPEKRVPMASLTKVMAAIVALEHPKEGLYKVYPEDLVGEDSMGLSAGESLSLSDLLYGLILHSGNDAAETLASNFPGGRTAFIAAMNEKAQALGLSNTHFTNPTGLEGDGNQYTTVDDLLVITRYALTNFPLFAKVAKTFDYTIPATSTHKTYVLENETNLLTSYPGVKGVKTGFTPEAGLCLITYLDYSGHKIMVVLLGSEDRRQEMKDILDYSLEKLHITPPRHA